MCSFPVVFPELTNPSNPSLIKYEFYFHISSNVDFVNISVSCSLSFKQKEYLLGNAYMSCIFQCVKSVVRCKFIIINCFLHTEELLRAIRGQRYYFIVCAELQNHA